MTDHLISGTLGYWMSDKPLVQQQLAANLSSILLSIEKDNDDMESSTNAALDFISGFWEAMVREWVGIDRLR